MKKLLKYIDRRIVGMLGAMVLVFLVLNFTWVDSASRRLDANRKEKTEAELEYNQLRSRLGDIRADGVTSSAALLSRLERLEALLPFAADDISISQIVIAAAESSGAVLERFQPGENPPPAENSSDADKKEAPKDPSVVGGLKSYRYDFKVSGSYLAVSNFLNSTIGSRSVVVTFDGLYMYSATKADNPTIFDEVITVEGQLLIWTTLEKHLSSGGSQPTGSEGSEDAGAPTTSTSTPVADGDASAPTDGGEGAGTDPSAPVSTPTSQPTSSTTVPG